MRLKERRPKRAQQHPRRPNRAPAPVRVQDRVPAPVPAPAGGPRRSRRTSPGRSRRTGQVFSPQEGLQVLHGEDRRDPLSRRTAAARVCGRARQDRAPAAHRRLHHAPAPPDPRYQAGPEHRPAAVCHAALSLPRAIAAARDDSWSRSLTRNQCRPSWPAAPAETASAISDSCEIWDSRTEESFKWKSF